MDLLHICSAFADPDLNIRLRSLEELTKIPIDDETLVKFIIPNLFKYLDDCEEVLLLAITQIVKLSQSCQTSSTALLLIQPLEQLSTIIDNDVRHNSVEAIIRILSFFSLTEDYSMKLIRQLASENQSGLISALELILSTYSSLTLKKQQKLIHFLLQQYNTTDLSSQIKIAKLISALPNAQDHSCIFSLCMEEFLKSPEDLIRICGIDLAISLKADVFTTNSIENDDSWKVRYFIGQKIAILIEFMNHDKLCMIVKKYLNDFEVEVRNSAFLSLPALFKHTKDEVFINEILTHVHNMSSELPFISFEVISSVLQICSIVGKQNTELYLLSALQKLLGSQNNNIEMFLMQEIRKIAPVVSENFLFVHAFPVFFKLLEHKSWKIRAKCLNYLPGFGFLPVDTFNTYFIQYIMTSLNDLVHAVRTEAIKAVSLIYDVYGPEWFELNMKDEIYTKSQNDCYINRITSVNLLLELVKKLDFHKFGEFFFEIFCRLATDKVSNVRICVARLGSQIDASRVLENFKESFFGSVEKLKCDSDQDVRVLVVMNLA